MNDRLFRVAGAVLVAVFGIWGGLRIHAGRIASHDAMGTLAPVRETRSPMPGEAADQSSPRSTKIPDRLPAFSLSDLQGKSTPIATWTGNRW